MSETYLSVWDLLFHNIFINQIKEVSNTMKEHLLIVERMCNINLEYKAKDKDTKSKFNDIEKEYQNF